MKHKLLIILGILILVVGIGVIMVVMESKNQTNYDNIKIEILGTDKSMYSPEDTAKLEYKIINVSDKDLKNSLLILKVSHLENVIVMERVQTVSLAAGEEQIKVLEWKVPDKDFTGYLLEVGIADKKDNIMVSDTIGADVSTSWIKFPRYGYLCDFGPEVDEQNKIDQMNRYHINGIEYYDWHYLHHQPLEDGITRGNPGSWEDWAGRKISGQTVADYIREAKSRNMVSMAYNMIYAGTDTFFTDENGNPTKANEWNLFFAEDNERGKGNMTFRMGTSPSGNSNLIFVNPLNKEWQQHIFKETLRIFEAFDFDGWHGDTVGDWGKMVTSQGEPLGYKEDGTPIYYVRETYTQFLNAAKEALGDKYLSFNPVGAQGIEHTNISKTDVLYTEFWPWDSDREGVKYDTYMSLVREVERSFEDSKAVSFDGKGKSLVVKAYINYYKTNGFMNAPGVLLCDAAVYAAGGSRLEIGNGDRMLHVEYYPNDNVLMDVNLTDKMRRMSDFTVAYENLLRDGQFTTDNKVIVADYPHGKKGRSDTIWAYTRADNHYEILHLINLLDTDNEWRDERGKKDEPQEAKDFKITYYTDKQISEVYIASPDWNNCKSEMIAFETGVDQEGSYITFSIPYLQYWDMIYMK